MQGQKRNILVLYFKKPCALYSLSDYNPLIGGIALTIFTKINDSVEVKDRIIYNNIQ